MNHYKFPKITDIQQIRDAIVGRDELFIAERPYGYIANYMLHGPRTFIDEDPEKQALLRECRGLIFGLDGRVLSRRLHKFFNVGEKEETLPNNLDFTHKHIVMDKLDGSMITPIIMPNGEVRFGTKMGLTDVSAQAERYVDSCVYDYISFARDCHDTGVTPIFEWTSRQQRIVLDYPVDSLKLIAMRSNVLGTYFTPDLLHSYANTYDLPVCNWVGGSPIDNINGLTRVAETIEGIEGYVIRFDDGHMLKVKTPWYVRLHQAKDSINFEKNVIKMIIEENVDDVKQSLQPQDLDRIEIFESEFLMGLLEQESIIWDHIESVLKTFPTKKDYALDKHYVDSIYRHYVFKMWDRPREELMTLIKKKIIESTGSQTNVDAARWLWRGARWEHTHVE